MPVEAHVEAALLRDFRTREPDATLAIQRLDETPADRLRSILTVTGLETAAAAEALAADGTVDDVRTLPCPGSVSQLRCLHQGDVRAQEVYRAMVATDGVFLCTGGPHTDWCHRLCFPDREALSSFTTVAPDEALPLQAVFERDGSPWTRNYGLSEPQAALIRMAAEQGYFAVPREVALAEVAAELDISSQAASERLRRGLDTLVQHSLLTDE